MLSYRELVRLVEDGVIQGVDPARINGASIDITLSNEFVFEDEPKLGTECVELAKKQNILGRTYTVSDNGAVYLHPGDFCLASSREKFYLPDDIAADYKLKSSMARNGLGHLLAGFCDPSWHNAVLTLEFVNHLRSHTLILRPGMPCGQMRFFRVTPVPEDRGYAARGQYNACVSVTPSKGIR